jgi:uncharacterized protein GlcG (DUF336 family)
MWNLMTISIKGRKMSNGQRGDFIKCGPSLFAGIPTLARVAAWGGGFPIKVDGEIVGAIGVSGAPAVQNDVDCAKAALALVPDEVPAG